MGAGEPTEFSELVGEFGIGLHFFQLKALRFQFQVAHIRRGALTLIE